MARTGATFELERLELDEERLIVRGWWFGVRGLRFVRPGIIVDGRQVALATLEHKPWAADEDGAWIAAFPWKRRGLDMAGVTLTVGPSVEVPLDRDAAPVEEPPDELPRGAAAVPAAPRSTVEEVRPARDDIRPQRDEVRPLRDELDGIERQLDAMHVELREARAHAAERDARCRELEGVVARERRAALDAEAADEEFVAAHAMAVLDRDRALAQHAEAVNDREAAVRAHKRMERQAGEALAAKQAAEAARDEALSERDELRKQRDELALAHQALQAQLKQGWARDAERTQAQAPTEEPRVDPSAPAVEPAGSARGRGEPSHRERAIGVRTIPRARTVAASLHRSQREREHGVTQYDMWVIRILGTVASLAFISLLVMILKAFFVF